MQKLPSLGELIKNLEELPSIGKKSAIRMAMFMVKDKFSALKLANAIESAVTAIQNCKYCGNLTEDEICHICLEEREHKICIVESNRDILLLEENKIFKGYYFVMHRLDASHLEKLENFIDKKEIEEIIFAFTHSMQNEANSMYIEDKLKDKNLKFTKIAQGVPTGVNLENVDITSIHRAFEKRVEV